MLREKDTYAILENMWYGTRIYLKKNWPPWWPYRIRIYANGCDVFISRKTFDLMLDLGYIQYWLETTNYKVYAITNLGKNSVDLAQSEVQP